MQKNKIILLFFVTIIFQSIVFAKVPVNLNDAKRAIVAYYQSGEYDRDVGLKIQSAAEYLKDCVSKNKTHQTLAMVLDVDDASISNFNLMKNRDFSNAAKDIERSYQSTHLAVIKPVLDLYNQALKNHIKLFFISLRPERYRGNTERNLTNAGFHNWNQLYLYDQKNNSIDTKVFKQQIRKQLTREGYRIILNIGDQPSDFVGGYAEKNIQLPNPLYDTKKR